VIYRPGLNQSNLNGATMGTTAILAEREVHDNGINVLFVDGHTEWVEQPRASEILEEIKAAAAETKR